MSTFSAAFVENILKRSFSEDNRSSCPEVFYRKGALKDVAKFTRKHLCQGLVFKMSRVVDLK